MKAFVVVLTLLVSIGASLKTEARSSSYPFKNLDQIKTQLGFRPFYSKVALKRVKIAVIDQGFDNYDAEVGKTLPADTVFHADALQGPVGRGGKHGTIMAELVTALMTDEGTRPDLAPELHLYNVFGYSNFKAAIDDAINTGVDIILNSEVWDYGSNFDGRGFFNTEVSRATKAGIIWVGAAGNFRLTTYNGTVATGPGYWLTGLPSQSGAALSFNCEQNEENKCSLRLVLSWTDFKDDVSKGTTKDLDLVIFDAKNNEVQASQLRQTAGAESDQEGFSKYPRELITAPIEPGQYFVKIKNHSKSFVAGDRYRISASGENIKFSYGDLNENLMNPADNPNVVTVGATDSDRSSISIKLRKPELAAPSSVVLLNGEEYLGSSNAAAFIAAGFGTLKSFLPTLGRADLLKLTSNPNSNSTYILAGLSSATLGFTGTGNGQCFKGRQNPAANPALQSARAYGGSFVETTVGTKLMVGYDPIGLLKGQRRTKVDDMVVANAAGYRVVPRAQAATLNASDTQIFQVPLDIGLCGVGQRHIVGGTTPTMLSPFRLPGIR